MNVEHRLERGKVVGGVRLGCGRGASSSVVAEISVSTRCNQRTTPIIAILAPFRPLRQLHPRVTHWRGTLNSVSLPRSSLPRSPSLRVSFARSTATFLLLWPEADSLHARLLESVAKRSSIVLLFFPDPLLPRRTTLGRWRFDALRLTVVMRAINGEELCSTRNTSASTVCCVSFRVTRGLVSV